MNEFYNLQSEIVSTLQCHPRSLETEHAALKLNIERVLQEIRKFLVIAKKEISNELLTGIPPCIDDFVNLMKYLHHGNIQDELMAVRTLIANRPAKRERSGRLKPILEDLQRRTKYTLWSWRIRDS